MFPSSSLMFDSCIPVSQWTISDLVFPSIYIPPILSFYPRLLICTLPDRRRSRLDSFLLETLSGDHPSYHLRSPALGLAIVPSRRILRYLFCSAQKLYKYSIYIICIFRVHNKATFFIFSSPGYQKIKQQMDRKFHISTSYYYFYSSDAQKKVFSLVYLKPPAAHVYLNSRRGGTRAQDAAMARGWT